MWPAIIQSAGKLGGDIFTATANSKTAKYNAQLEADTNRWITEQNIKSARDLTTMQNEYNTEMWNKQNAYNDPSNQAALYEKAGYHKQAVLGQFSSSAASAQGAAGIMPDFSKGQGKAKKVAFVLPKIGEYVSDFLSILDKLEDYKQNKLRTKIAGHQENMLYNESLYSPDFYRYRSNRLLQDYYLRGGDLSSTDAKEIRSSLMDDVRVRSKLLSNQYDMERAKYVNYNKYGTGILQEQYQQLKDRNWLFKNIEKPFQENYGSTYRTLDSAVNVIGRVLSSFLRLPFFSK